MSKAILKIEAIKLRKKGLPLGDISKKLKISKSTASLWCRDIKMSDDLINKIKINHYLKTNKGRLIGARMNKEKKLRSIHRANNWGTRIVNKINRKEAIMILTALYWSEGSKTDNSTGFQLINSDPYMILLVKNILTKYFKINQSDFVCSIQINEIHRPRIKIVLNFWENLLELSDRQIRKPYFIKTKNHKIYENYDNYYGICKLIVKKSTNLKYIMLGLIKALKDSNMSM